MNSAGLNERSRLVVIPAKGLVEEFGIVIAEIQCNSLKTGSIYSFSPIGSMGHQLVGIYISSNMKSATLSVTV